MSYPPRCLDCAYVLVGLPAGKCPECGREFDPDRPGTFSDKPLFDRWRFWLPGFLLAAGGGAIGFALLISAAGWGVTATLVGPFCLGAVIGYGCRVAILVRALLAIAALLTVGVALFSMQLAGIFCGLMFAVVALGPLLIGTGVGAMLRMILKASSFEQRWYLPTMMMFALLALCGIVEHAIAPAPARESVVTSIEIPAPVGRVWNAMMFYEEVHARRPWLLRLGLPTPLRTYGSVEDVGDVKFCIYSKGRLAKQVTRRVPNELLAFHVVVQDRFENHSIRLTDGSFALVAETDQLTRVDLTTRYEPKLRPRWIWRPVERWATHTMHRYILEGMRTKASES